MEEDLVTRLRKRAEIHRQISTRKSVQEGKPDRIADLLEEAANELERYQYGDINYWCPACYADTTPNPILKIKETN
jgi:hypothetical protein